MRTIVPIVTLLVSSIALSSCIIRQYNVEELKRGESLYLLSKRGTLVQCGPWIPPTLPPAPGIPNIPDRVLGNKDAEQDILLKSLSIHRNYIIRIKKIYDDSFDDYVNECKRQ